MLLRTGQRLRDRAISDWLRHDDVILLSGEPTCDPQELARAVAPFGLSAGVTTRSALAQAEIRNLLLKHGVSYLWQLAELREDILPRSSQTAPLLQVISDMLARLAPTNELIVVDAYLLREAQQVHDLVSIIWPIASQLKQVLIVYGKEQPEHLRKLQMRLTDCSISARVSGAFHDRFWIADRSRGLFVGCSLNAVGLKYALVDLMQSSDVKDIVKGLDDEQLLPDSSD